MADPEFPGGGVQTLEGVLKATIWHTFCRELDENERFLTERGVRFRCTPSWIRHCDPQTFTCTITDLNSVSDVGFVGTVLLVDQTFHHSQQECIPVGCVPSTAVAVMGDGTGGVCLEWGGGGCLPSGCLPRGCLPRGVSGRHHAVDRILDTCL